MSLRDLPIRRRLMIIILLTSALVMFMMQLSFFVFDYVTFRRATARQFSMLGEVIADNSTAALAFQNQADAEEILAALRAEEHVVAAALYDRDGRLFSRYPRELPDTALPDVPGSDGYQFHQGQLIGFQPVEQEGGRLGTLYVELGTRAMIHDRMVLSAGMSVAVVSFVFVLAYVISRTLQKQISEPILSLANTARAISQHRDYSVRATRSGNDELGLLTDAFNQMLAQIQKQNQALREGEERVRAIINSALSAVVVVDSDGSIIDWNARAEAMFGWTRQEALGRKLDDTIIPPQHRAAHQQGMKQYLATGKGPILGRLVELSAVRRDGAEFPVELSISAVEADGVLTFCGFITDITDRKHAEQQIYQLNASLEQRVAERTSQLEAVNKELEAFSYSVSHDLRAPLRHISGFADILRQNCQSNLDGTGRRHLQVISNSAKQMGVLIDGLLAFSRMGRVELRKTDVQMAELVAEVRDAMNAESDGRNIVWEIGSLPGIGCDPLLLKQVWANLLSNALKYTRHREQPVIKISCRDNGRREWEFSISDNGAGFDMKYVGKLFGVFQRLHTVDEFEGTGIGLANVQRIIMRHGGRVWAEGRVDAGATFYFTLPETGELNT